MVWLAPCDLACAGLRARHGPTPGEGASSAHQAGDRVARTAVGDLCEVERSWRNLHGSAAHAAESRCAGDAFRAGVDARLEDDLTPERFVFDRSDRRPAC